MKKRKKAQDVFNETNFMFSNKTTFEKAFPEIEKISVKVKESGKGIYRSFQSSYYEKKSLGEYINCNNSFCYNGGFNIGEIIRKMGWNRETEKEGSAICQGHEGSPKGRRIYGKCLNHFDYNIKIEYKEDKKPEENDKEDKGKGGKNES